MWAQKGGVGGADPLKDLYSDPKQLRALYSDVTASNAWTDGLRPTMPQSARVEGAAANVRSARLSHLLADQAGKPLGQRGAPQSRKYGECYQAPATARALSGKGWVPMEAPGGLKEAKNPHQPDCTRPLTTPRQTQQEKQPSAASSSSSSTSKPAAAAAAPQKAAATPAPTTTTAASGVAGPYIPPPGTTFEYDGGSSVVLSPHTDPPTQKEIEDYAKWLGLDMAKETELFWLAREALQAPLPPYWRPCNTQDGEVYYFNFSTGESLWDHPMDALFKRAVEVERERMKTCKKQGQPYEATPSYINATIGAFLAHLAPDTAAEPTAAEAPVTAAAATTSNTIVTTDGVTITSGSTLLVDGVVEGAGGTKLYIPKAGTVFEYESGGFSAVLEDNADRYVPTEQEISDYAQWLGLRDDEAELRWIAKDGLTTPLPEPWRPCKTDNGDLYYFNFETGESSWEHPMDVFFQATGCFGA